MITNKSKIAEKALRLLGKYTDDTDIKLGELELRVHDKLASSIKKRHLESKNVDVEEVPEGTVFTFTGLSVKEDETGRFYTELPSTSIDLLYGQGIRQVGGFTEEKGETYNFRRVPLGFDDIYEGLDGSELQGRIGYEMSNDRLYYTNMERKFKNVFIKMVSPLDGLGSRDDINIPPDLQDEVIQLVVKEFTPNAQQPTDEMNDQVDRI